MLDLFPDSTAVIADFFITDQKHYEALYYPIRAGEISVEDLDRVLGDPKAITKLVNKAPSNPHKGIVFGEGSGLGNPRAHLWEKLWGTYIEKLQRIDELKKAGRYGYQLRMPYKSLKLAQEALLKEFPEADVYLNPEPPKTEMGLHTQEEQIEAVDMAADALSRGLDAAAANNLFGLATEIGYLRALTDLALSEGVEALATIAHQHANLLVSKFESMYSQIA